MRKFAGSGLKSSMKWMLLAMAVPACGWAQELMSYDRLGKDNVTVTAAAIKSGSKMERTWQTSWGSFSRDVTQTKLIEVKLSKVAGGNVDVKVEFYSVIESASGKDRIEAGKRMEGTGAEEWVFESTVEGSDTRYAYSGSRYKSGDKIIGWFVRAIRGNKVVGFAASPRSYDELASNPKALASALSKQED